MLNLNNQENNQVMTQIINHNDNSRLNAADRKSFVGEIYNIGKKIYKDEVKQITQPHTLPLTYEHDADAYGKTYNCLGLNIKEAFPYALFLLYDVVTKIVRVFDFMKELFAKMGNEQSGGMAIVNFDLDFAEIFTKLGVTYKGNEALFRSCIHSLILWCNNMHTRMGQTSYYVSFNTGLGTDDFSRFLTFTLIDDFENAGVLVFKPNIIFKVKEGINRNPEDPNFDLYQKALNCTAKKMIPTYLLCDCEEDRNVPAEKLSVMGCRSRVVDDVFGCQGSVGRGNIANVSINLPMVASVPISSYKKKSTRIIEFKRFLKLYMDEVAVALYERYVHTVCDDSTLFPTNHEFKLWCEDMNKVGIKETLKHGTLSIGFIGLSETIEILTGKKYWEEEKNYQLALEIVAFMRNCTDSYTKKYGLNYSLLATAGEYISGYFADEMKKIKDTSVVKNIPSEIYEKGYLTNSFHVEVDSKLSAIKKLQLEGPFHKYANGGSISYVELGEAPLGNTEGLSELVEVAVESGVRYLGFNFPKDVCRGCGSTGLFDECPSCKSRNITRIRRVSGYLEILDGFTSGKKAEEANRKRNEM